MLQVKLFARARQLVGQSQVGIPWSDGDSVLRLKEQLSVLYPSLAPAMSGLLVAVNNEYAQDSAFINNDDEVACFPPVSGG